MQLEISVFGNHAASRKSDKLLSATEQRQANDRNKEWPMRAVQKRSILIQVKKKKLSEDATSNLCVRKPRSKSWWWQSSNFSLQYRSWIKYLGYENLGNEHRLRKLWIVA